MIGDEKQNVPKLFFRTLLPLLFVLDYLSLDIGQDIRNTFGLKMMGNGFEVSKAPFSWIVLILCTHLAKLLQPRLVSSSMGV
jgi:hypothetical protein